MCQTVKQTGQERVHIAGLRLLSLINPACKVGCNMETWIWGESHLTVPRTDESCSWCLNYLYELWFYAKYLLSF